MNNTDFKKVLPKDTIIAGIQPTNKIKTSNKYLDWQLFYYFRRKQIIFKKSR